MRVPALLAALALLAAAASAETCADKGLIGSCKCVERGGAWEP